MFFVPFCSFTSTNFRSRKVHKAGSQQKHTYPIELNGLPTVSQSRSHALLHGGV